MIYKNCYSFRCVRYCIVLYCGCRKKWWSYTCLWALYVRGINGFHRVVALSVVVNIALQISASSFTGVLTKVGERQKISVVIRIRVFQEIQVDGSSYDIGVIGICNVACSSVNLFLFVRKHFMTLKLFFFSQKWMCDVA